MRSLLALDSLAAFRHRNFRLLWTGLLLSFSGGFMQNAALLWHVSLLAPEGRKGVALGTVGVARLVPIIVLSLFSGVAADVWSRRRLMLATQTGAAAVALGLAAVTATGSASLWSIYLLAALGSAVNSFDLPARQAIVPLLVPREHLPSAVTLNAIMTQSASIVGPAVAGLLIATTDLAWVYFINALSFGFVIVAILKMRGVPEADAPVGTRGAVSWRAAVDGLRYVVQVPILRATTLLDFSTTFFASATILLPIFAQDILHVGPERYGWLSAAPAVGALLTSAVMVIAIGRIERRGPVLLAASGLYGVATVGFGTSRTFWMTFSFLALMGVADSVGVIVRNVVRQLETEDRMRGRIMSLSRIFFQTGRQLGDLEAGAVANWIGAPLSVVAGGIGCLIAAGWVALSTPPLRAYRTEPQHVRLKPDATSRT